MFYQCEHGEKTKIKQCTTHIDAGREAKSITLTDKYMTAHFLLLVIVSSIKSGEV